MSEKIVIEDQNAEDKSRQKNLNKKRNINKNKRTEQTPWYDKGRKTMGVRLQGRRTENLKINKIANCRFG